MGQNTEKEEDAMQDRARKAPILRKHTQKVYFQGFRYKIQEQVIPDKSQDFNGKSTDARYKEEKQQ